MFQEDLEYHSLRKLCLFSKWPRAGRDSTSGNWDQLDAWAASPPATISNATQPCASRWPQTTADHIIATSWLPAAARSAQAPPHPTPQLDIDSFFPLTPPFTMGSLEIQSQLTLPQVQPFQCHGHPLTSFILSSIHSFIHSGQYFKQHLVMIKRFAFEVGWPGFAFQHYAFLSVRLRLLISRIGII